MSLNQDWFAFSFLPMVCLSRVVARAARAGGGLRGRTLAGGGCYNRLNTGGGIVAGWWNGWY